MQLAKPDYCDQVSHFRRKRFKPRETRLTLDDAGHSGSDALLLARYAVSGELVLVRFAGIRDAGIRHLGAAANTRRNDATQT